jgi:membrane protein YdbS with pleckstrin-like domain
MKTVYHLKYNDKAMQMTYPLRKSGFNAVIGIVLLLIGLPFIVVSTMLIFTPQDFESELSALLIELTFLIVGLIVSAIGIVNLTGYRHIQFNPKGIQIRITGIFRYTHKFIPVHRIKGMHIEVHQDAQHPDMIQAEIEYIETYSLYILTNKGRGRILVFGRFDSKSEVEELEEKIARTLLLTKSTETRNI